MVEFQQQVRLWAWQYEPGLSWTDLDDIGAEVFGHLRRLLYREITREIEPGTGGGPGGNDAHRFRDAHQLGSYLRQTTFNVARNTRRKYVRRANTEETLTGLTDRSPDLADADPSSDAAELAEYAELDAAVSEIMGGQPSDLRDALAAKMRGLTQEEAAAQLGISRRTYRDRLERAQRALENELRRRGQHPGGEKDD